MDAKTIAAKHFARGAFGSYKSDDVDAFFQEVITYVKGLEKERDDLLRDIKLLADKTEEYRSNEDAVQEALIKAQKYGNKIINDAKTEAEEIETEAKTKAAEIIDSAQEKAHTISVDAIEQTEVLIRELKNKALVELNELKQKTAIERNTLENAKIAASSFKADLFELYRIHLDTINRIPDLGETDYRPEVLPDLNEQENAEAPEETADAKAADSEPEAAETNISAETNVSTEASAESSAESSAEETTEKSAGESTESSAEADEEAKPAEESAEADEAAAAESDAKQEAEQAQAPENDGDTQVIPVESIDGDQTPEDVRRTMQNTSKPVYGRKFTDLKFGSGK